MSFDVGAAAGNKLNNESIHSVLEFAPICCFILNLRGKILDCNQHALDLFEAKGKADLKGMSLMNLAPKYQPSGELTEDYAKRIIGYTMQEGTGKTEAAARTLSGKNIMTEVTCLKTIFHGKPCIFLYARETSEHFANVIKLEGRRDADMRLRTIFDNIPMACHLRDASFNILDCNQACPDFFGLRDKQEFIDRFFDLSPELQPCGKTTLERTVEVTREAYEKGRVRFEWLHIHSNGELIPAEVSLTRVRWQNGDYLLAVTRDLREAYKLRDAESSVRQRLQLMLDSSPMACTIYDEQLNILEANREIANLFGINDKREFMNNFYIFSPEYQPDGRLSKEKMYEIIKTAFDLGKMNFGWMHQTLDGKPIPCEKTLELVELDGAKLMISYTRDLREINHALSMVEHLKKLAYIDPLTGAHNRRYFMDEAEVALKESIAANLPFSLIMADIDFFKAVNDTYGHDVGDEILQILVKRMQHVLREMPVARYGGEEFVVLLPNVNSNSAQEIAWRIQKNIVGSKFKVSNGVEIAITASFGVASKTDVNVSLLDILKSSDQALYQAKASGRNRVVTYKQKVRLD